MPMNRNLYPKNWGQIALDIKTAADWNCQQCGRPCRRPGEDDEELISRVSGSEWEADLFEAVDLPEMGLTLKRKLGRFLLTVSHLNHQPADCRPENLRASCTVCHCRYDLADMARKQRLKSERLGQLTLPVRDEP
ncbi:MAG: HNH endonuclease [Pegethrix bostrychoides GSE-TBD4-15B]|jgi:hypothetical protein|uniref:HNH endonuclease n=1 Tax=Pegethrix bostrychoides GSE-TBD4-15B TaxID=2839662 RepID=A0A951P9X5_9CYAN|nr:HNH endonuclease [Pegethrix bostrychoides GSE-TBD4-15B]